MAAALGMSVFAQEKKEVNIVDREKYNALIKRFDLNTDKFDEITWYWHKRAPEYDKAGIYCYFGVVGDSLTPLRFGINYVAGDWLFIRRAQIKIGAKVYDLPLTKVTRETVYRPVGPGIKEGIDEKVTGLYANLIEVLASITDGDDVLIKLQGNDDRSMMALSSITSWAKQLQALKETVELYKAMGGTY